MGSIKKSLRWERIKTKVKAFFRKPNVEKYTYHVVVKHHFIAGFSTYRFAEEYIKSTYSRKIRREKDNGIEIYTIKIQK